MHNHLPLPIALLYSIRGTVQSLQHLVGAFPFPAYFGTLHHLQPDSVIWFVHGASDAFVVPIFLALLFHASSPAYITVQAIQVLAKMPNVLAGDLLLATDEIDGKSHFLAIQDSTGCRGSSVMLVDVFISIARFFNGRRC
ncbi:conserved hypothetical protein [Trichinella spiralis]|uniref:hypothetical protein n=1 Tax=Trichinella spiralis TaxID=6334 RepID=UPI0001EFD3C3|nr:conserved hypothetical protein [Trichinella spiralis]